MLSGAAGRRPTEQTQKRSQQPFDVAAILAPAPRAAADPDARAPRSTPQLFAAPQGLERRPTPISQ